MKRTLSILCILIAAPGWASDGAFPNKPGKKPLARLVVGAQSGAVTKAPKDVVVGAGVQGARTGGGDYGFNAPALRLRSAPKRSVGYDPAAHLGNKRPNS